MKTAPCCGVEYKPQDEVTRLTVNRVNEFGEIVFDRTETWHLKCLKPQHFSNYHDPRLCSGSTRY